MKEFYARLLAFLEEYRRLAVATVVEADGYDLVVTPTT